MTTRTFAKKSGRQHGNVMSMLRKMVENGELDLQESFYNNGSGSRQYAEFKLTLNDFEKIAHKLKEKEIKGVRKYFGVPAYSVEKVVTGFGDHTVEIPAFAGVQAAPTPVQLSLVPTAETPQGDGLTMSSVEIHKLTGKQHAHVMRDIEKMLEDLNEGGASRFGASYFSEQNKSLPCFKLPRRETDILLTGYSVPLRAKVIDRWRELEAEVAKPQFVVPTTFAAALRLAGELEEQRLVLTHQVEVQGVKIAEDAPKVEVYHKIADSRGLIGFQKFCTQLNLNQKEIKHWMKDIGWLRADQYVVNPLPTAKAVDNGYCRITGFTTEHGKFTQQIWFTGKAVTYVAEKAPTYVRKKVKASRSKAA
ncbi:Rha family transcriptional regulator [Pseudomonas sp. UYIF39]|uniref:Rha family transcriptional regulator n=1 Tax=Pseudomonas sp. UYIF39 TaxID=1630747 RepID=UPI00249F136D|nr:Rha family transcriptional regulator [Pseudomonas sp. UYIF39]MDI3356885.1 Rha family transcriptional regulator [Pseudomonas sp. UYIF39]